MAYTDLITLLEQQMDRRGELETDKNGERFFKATTPLGAVHFMAMRTAGHIVRNVATIGGNLMLVLHHIAKGSGEPFPSDLAIALWESARRCVSSMSERATKSSAWGSKT